jgi:hypothetical protein
VLRDASVAAILVAMRVEEIRRLPHYRIPVVGQDVVVGSSYYLSHGVDDFDGGLCQITEIIKDPECPNSFNRLFVRVAERPSSQYNWYALMEREAENRKHYGGRRGKSNPDYTPEFNRWD